MVRHDSGWNDVELYEDDVIPEMKALRTDNGPTEYFNQQWRNPLLRSDPGVAPPVSLVPAADAMRPAIGSSDF